MKYAAPAVLAVGIVGIGLAGTPRILSNFSFFEIRQVEILGVRYLTPDQLLDAARIEEAGNLLRSLDEVEARIRNVPGIVDVRLDRKLPGTLRIAVTERVPVAFVVGPDQLVPVDEDAKPLPYDPTAGALDLPVIRKADTILTRVLGEVRRSAPALFDEVDLAEKSAAGAVVLVAGEQRLIMSPVPSRDVVQSVVAVRRRILEADGDFTELDGTYEGLVISRGGGR